MKQWWLTIPPIIRKTIYHLSSQTAEHKTFLCPLDYWSRGHIALPLSIRSSHLECIVCPTNSSYSFWARPFIFCRQFRVSTYTEGVHILWILTFNNFSQNYGCMNLIHIGYMVCPVNSSYSFWARPFIFCRVVRSSNITRGLGGLSG